MPAVSVSSPKLLHDWFGCYTKCGYDILGNNNKTSAFVLRLSEMTAVEVSSDHLGPPLSCFWENIQSKARIQTEVILHGSCGGLLMSPLLISCFLYSRAINM